MVELFCIEEENWFLTLSLSLFLSNPLFLSTPLSLFIFLKKKKKSSDAKTKFL